MRATLPVSSLMRQGRQSSNSLRKSNNNSPTVSPTNAAAWRARISPDTSSSGQRSPGSLSYKGTSYIDVGNLLQSWSFGRNEMYSGRVGVVIISVPVMILERDEQAGK